MRQQTFASDDIEKYRKKTRTEVFLEEMGQISPWKLPSKVIKPYHPNPKGAGRRPIGIERMLRIHFLQPWLELSDPGAEEALYDSRAMRHFVGIYYTLMKPMSGAILRMRGRNNNCMNRRQTQRTLPRKKAVVIVNWSSASNRQSATNR